MNDQPLSDEEIAALWDAPEAPTSPAYDHEAYRYFVPLPEAANDFIFQSRTVGERVYTGIDEFDHAMRGLARKEIMIVQGFAHSGKTLFVTQLMKANTDKRVILFTPDESRVLVLVKLASLVTGVSAEEYERRIASGDTTAEDELRAVATTHFPNLAVFDEVNDLRSMDAAYLECRAFWGHEPDVVIFDYIDLLAGDSGGDGATAGKVNALKAWGKRRNHRLILLHQSSRTAGKDGAEVTISSGAYGGEQQATFVVGVRRKRDQWRGRLRDLEEKRATQANPSERLDEQIADAKWQLDRHWNTITFNLVKNKRPPSRLVDEVDFILDHETGALTRDDRPFGRDAPGPASRVLDKLAPPRGLTPPVQSWDRPFDDEEF